MTPIGPVTRPHPPLPEYYDDEIQRQRYVRRLFDETAVDYDRIERILAFGTGEWYRRQALALIGPQGRLVGVDPSAGMLAQSDLPGVELLDGTAEALPVADASFDFVTMGYALRHIGDVGAAFREFHRVLKPGGSVLILEITRPASVAGTACLKAYMRGVVPLIARAVSRGKDTPELWRYFWDTIEACVPPQRVLDTLLDAGFTGVQRLVELGLFSEYRARKSNSPAPAAR